MIDGLIGLHEAVVGDALDDEGEVVDGEGGGENEEEVERKRRDGERSTLVHARGKNKKKLR